MVRHEVADVLQAWVDAQREHDAERHASLYTEDGVLEDVPNGFAARGRAAILAFVTKANEGFSDVEVEVVNTASSLNAAAVEYLFTATNTGMIPIPGTKGKRFTSRAVTFFELRDGLIARSSDYYDTSAVVRQLGGVVGGLAGLFGPLHRHD